MNLGAVSCIALLASLVLPACSSSDAPFVAYIAEVDTTNPAGQWKALAGISAFLDQADGKRIEAVSDATGRVEFPAADFTAGPATITAYGPGYIISTAYGVTPELVAQLELPLAEFPAGGKNLLAAMLPDDAPTEDTVTLSGTIKNKLADTNFVTMSAASGRATFQASTASFALPVLRGKPLTFVVLEWRPTGTTSEEKLRWLQVDVPAQSADGTYDIDLSTGKTIDPTKISLTLQGPDGSLPPFWGVFSAAPWQGLFLGSRSVVTPDASMTSYHVEAEYVKDPASGSPMSLAIFPGSDGASAFNQMLGLPTDGATIQALAFPTTPASGGVGMDVAVAGVAAGSAAGIDVVNHLGPNNDRHLWSIGVMKGAPVPASIHVPELPPAARAMLSAAPKARLTQSDGSVGPMNPELPGRVAFSSFFDFTP